MAFSSMDSKDNMFGAVGEESSSASASDPTGYATSFVNGSVADHHRGFVTVSCKLCELHPRRGLVNQSISSVGYHRTRKADE